MSQVSKVQLGSCAMAKKLCVCVYMYLRIYIYIYDLEVIPELKNLEVGEDMLLVVMIRIRVYSWWISHGSLTSHLAPEGEGAENKEQNKQKKASIRYASFPRRPKSRFSNTV